MSAWFQSPSLRTSPLKKIVVPCCLKCKHLYEGYYFLIIDQQHFPLINQIELDRLGESITGNLMKHADTFNYLLWIDGLSQLNNNKLADLK